MRLRVLSSLLLLFFPACQLAAQATSNTEKFSPPTRTFRFTYNVTVKDIPSGAKRVRVWIPVPQSDQHQTVRVLAVKAPVKTRMTREPEYGNRMMYAEIQNSAPGKAEFTLEYKVTRREYSPGDYSQLKRIDQTPSGVKPAGSPLTSQRRGKRSRKKIIFSAVLTPIACSYPPAATSHCLLGRMVQPSITSYTRTSRSTVSRTISSTSSSALRK